MRETSAPRQSHHDMRYCAAPGRLLDYLARSSYWVYLLHFPVTIACGALLYRVDAPALVKMTINIAAVTALCLLTYHFLVRDKWIGRLLNGVKAAPTGAQPNTSPVLH